jgi:phosphate transport system permease protein
MTALSRIGTGGDHAADVVRAGLVGRRKDVSGLVFRVLLQLALALSVLVLAVLLWDVLNRGLSVITDRGLDFFTGDMRSFADETGIYQGLLGSLWIGVFVVVLAFPIGIGAAVYLEEYAADTRLRRFFDVNIRNLAGVPSVVYGILGLAIFVQTLGDLTGGRSVIAAGMTLAILVLPIVIITSAEAIRAVPDSLREAGFGVGATRWEVVRAHVLPYAAPGILTGTVLSLARALGEAAPLILVGAVTGRLAAHPGPFDVGQLDDRFTAMPILITQWTTDFKPGFEEAAAAAIIVMLAVVLLFNTIGILLRNRYERKRT